MKKSKSTFRRPTNGVRKLIPIALAVALVLVFVADSNCAPKKEQAVPPAPPTSSAPQPSQLLNEHCKRFTKRVEEVTNGVYVAIGYSLTNCILVVTPQGRVIIDTTESMESAREIKKEFDKISNTPVLAVIYTHGHPDHILGTSVFKESGTEVYAQDEFMDFINQQYGLCLPMITVRGMRQFGTALPGGWVPCHGCGIKLMLDKDKTPIIVPPTKVFEDELEVNIGGQEFLLVHAPGETVDQLFVWLPDKKVLIPGDNYYPTFPNLYTIRGTTPRPIAGWFKSIDRMRDLGAEYLVPLVGGSIQGAERIDELLTAYRDAIQYIHDAVVRGINQEKTPDQLVEEIKLPPHLADIPELTELYGKISWSIRGIYEGYVGWFDGNATNLELLTARARAEKIIGLAGGKDKLVTEAKNALSNKEFQWAAEVADMLLAVDPTSTEAHEIKAEALFRLGESSYNSIARSYYLSQSQALRGKLEPPKPLKIDAEYAHTVDIQIIFSNLPIYFDPDAGANKLITGAFKLTDTGETYRAIVSKGVLEVRPGLPKQPDFTINIDSDTFKEMMLGVSKPTEAMMTGRMKVEGSWLKLLEFFSLFKR